MKPKQKKIRVGIPAVDFTLDDTNGERWRLREHRGRVVALLFYPGDETLVCTRQLCAMRDNWTKYLDTGAEIVGISPNSHAEHLSFVKRHNLPMRLLVDFDRRITAVYSRHWLFPVWTTRAVVVIDASGIVRYQNILLRAFRPTDDEVFTAIHLARYDNLTKRRGKEVRSL